MSDSLHFHLIDAVATALNETFSENRYADKVMERLFKKNRKWGARDRKFVAEMIYEIVRHKRRLEFIAGSDHPWDLVGAYLIQTRGELPNWMEFDGLNVFEMKKRNSAEKPPEIANSFPDWLNELGKAEFKDQWNLLMNALNKPAEVFLRVNTLRATPEVVKAELAAEQIEADLISSPDFQFPVCLKLKVRKNVFVTQAFRKGYFEVQDAASQQVAGLLDVAPGLRVVDTCAGAGGKSLHLAALMKNKGKIISMDIHEWKLKELKTRAARGGVDIIETKVIEGSKTIKRLENSFDRVLLDVPCSGLGVLRRNPDSKWKLSNEEISRLTALQKEIIGDYSKLCKVGGSMVYATCSILHRENEDQVQWFLSTEEGKKWQLEKEIRVWPQIHGYDGFYGARLKKNN
ncbi:MAG: RsmB/NOP family class I SAM-dependent RNA methyltransferase [Bdellovibrio sp.]|nr:RsmB/NOP family class I SAM-dependent RNA methyltransferase [Bdellovibrio sp.]